MLSSPSPRDDWERRPAQGAQTPGSQALDSFKLQVQEFVMVQEGLCVVVPCSIFYPSRGWSPTTPAYGFWFRDQTPKPSLPVATNKPDQDVDTNTQGRFQLLGDPSESCSLLIKEAHLEDSALYFFRFERGDYVKYNFMEYKFYLEVTALTQKPEIYVPEILQPWHQVTLFCAFNWIFDECPVPTLSWIGNTVSPHDASSRTSYFSELTFTPRPQDHNTELTCRVDFSGEGVSTENTVRLSVAYAPKDLVISISYTDEPALEPRGESPHLEVQKGQSLRLLCTADSLPLATLSWTLQDRVLSWSHPLGSTALELALPGVKAEDAGRYTCRAENRLGFLSRSLDLSVQYAPENLKVMVSQANRTALENLESGASLRVLEGQSLRLLCVAHSNPPAQLSWARLGRTVSPSQPSDPGVLELPQIQTEQEGEFICRAQNPLGSQNISLSLSVVSPPQLLGPSCSQEDEGLRCSCSSRARPAPSLRWRLGEGLLEGELSNASFEVASSSAGPWANSSLSLREGLSSGLRLSCEALNGHGVRSGSVLLLPDEKGLASGAFASGISLGIGVTTLLFLCFILILNRKPNQAVLPSLLLQMVTPWKPERIRRSSMSSPTTVQDPSHLYKPQKQRTTKRSSITLSSTSQALDHGRPKDPRARTQSTLKSSSTEGLLGQRTRMQARQSN
ncbi:sialic acid-binding Ig-like lectin 10 isoform X4 [Bubalus bubalis]|uniref:sialic acid-binding Ig-like lectin 10 isoform X4 n=1 Tax=Bubalus bubalis TaxID=89462 RepID=UPI001D1242A2|nr:sialic acid-binding Ig-like lectin 10 isoform X4 [Bubalus bubalis]